MTHSFRNSVLNAIGTGVPCRRPFACIKLLQLIGRDQLCRVKESSNEDDLLYFLEDNGECLVDPGNDKDDTLISLMDDSKLKKELEDLVKDAVEQPMTLSEQEKTSLEEEIPPVFISMASQKIDCVPSKRRLEPPHPSEKVSRRITATRRRSAAEKGPLPMFWAVSFKTNTIKRRAVSHHKLRKFLRSPHLQLDLERHMGVVTAIYFISGGLTFKGDASRAKKVGFNLNDVAEGWHSSVDKGTIVVKEIKPVEWIVAIEYRDVAMDKKDAAFGRRQLILIDPQASTKTSPLTLKS